jgi:hypothetical protein
MKCTSFYQYIIVKIQFEKEVSINKIMHALTWGFYLHEFY